MDKPEITEAAEKEFEEAIASSFDAPKEPESTEKDDDSGDGGEEKTPEDSPKEEPKKEPEKEPEEEPKEEKPEESTEDGNDEPEEDEPKVKLPKRPSKHPDLKEGDYDKTEDGKYVIKAEHLKEDIESILSKDAGIFLKIEKAKPEKANAIAEILGVKGDETRTPGQVMADVVRTIKSGDQDKANEIAKKHFPYLFDRNADIPFEISQDLIPLDDDSKAGKVEIEQPSGPTQSDIDTAIYRVVAESGGKFTLDDINNSKELPKLVSKYHFDPATGRPLTPYEKLKKATEEVFTGEEGDTPPPVNNGSPKKTASGDSVEEQKQKSVEDALMSAFQ